MIGKIQWDEVFPTGAQVNDPDFELDSLRQEWQMLKEDEEELKELRLKTEAQILKLIKQPDDHKGTVKTGDLTVSYGMSYKVDSQDLSNAEVSSGISLDRFDELFRTKYELNVAAWEEATEEEKQALSGAITTKPKKPSFKVSKKEEK